MRFAHLINLLLGKFGYRITRVRNLLSFESALMRLLARPVVVETVIDIGASDGRWSNIVRPFYPDASYLLIEANPIHENKLKSYKQTHMKTDYVLAAAGNQEGEIFFDSSDPLGGIASKEVLEGYRPIPMTTIDIQVQRRQLRPPFFLKLDTHGFEIPILEGATQTLQNTSLLLVEVYNFDLAPQSLRFHEMCAYLETKGFRPIDILDPLYRPTDSALWQFDLLFIPSNRPEFLDNTYR